MCVCVRTQSGAHTAEGSHSHGAIRLVLCGIQVEENALSELRVVFH